jgi:hypothetical protein
MLNRYRTELAVTALPEELEASAARTIAHLQAEAAEIAIKRVELRGNRLLAEVAVTNLGGHKLPTAYPSRRAWLHLVVRQANNEVVFESGRLDANGLIQGNDNDADPKKYEPHYSEIAAGDQVQIYESVMSDSSGAPTTELLAGIGYLKDNRLLPRGFDKPTAPEDISVKGRAAEDQNFQGGSDQILYSVAVDPATGPFQIEAELLYQPISYRWAENLRAYDAAETRRFTSYYDAMAPASGAMLARETARSQ